MVSATELSDTGSALLGPAAGLLTLRVCGTEHDGRVLHIRSPKCTIGADSSCTLRLRGAGIRPFHCLILRGTEGAFVRRLSPDTCLNGCSFDVARLHPTDRLAIGPIELEILPSAPCPDPEEPIAPSTSSGQEARPDTELARVCQRLEEGRRESEQDRHRLQAAVAQSEAAARRAESLETELSETRRSTQAAIAESEAAGSRVRTLETELGELRRNLEAAVAESEAAASRIHALEEELCATCNNLDEERATATHTLGQLEAELSTRDQRLTDAHKQLADRHQAAETNWKDVAEKLRSELQQARDEHRRVRDEWHVDRQGLERELAARSDALKQLDQKSKQDMREAETLIQSMQQEGKHLLAQLEGARQTIHQDIDRRKKRQALVNSGQPAANDPPPSLSAPASHTPTPAPPAAAEEPPADLPTPAPAASRLSDCPTMLMDVVEIARDPAASDPAESPPPAPPAGESTAPPSAEGADEENVIQRYMERLLRRVGRT